MIVEPVQKQEFRRNDRLLTSRGNHWLTVNIKLKRITITTISIPELILRKMILVHYVTAVFLDMPAKCLFS
ncbi:MAG TPA: hypothetical protein PKJ08_10800 [Candidatus Cloacimonadota bacterium]|nr:hypothetical protein [Candidatus Cloacimonadota bacterium]HOD55006.1 hypothetical protein [Candidatus Cloacimonadota bacterium]